MARVHVYERAVNAVFTGSRFDETSNLSNHGLKIKEESLDLDKDTPDESSSDNENTGDRCNIISPEAESSDGVNRTENECASAQVPNDSEYKKLNFYKVERKSLSSEDLASNDMPHFTSNKQVDQASSFSRRKQMGVTRWMSTCNICFLRFPHKKALSIHYKTVKNEGIGCKKCSAWFIGRTLWSRHQKMRNCKESCDARFKYACNFCDRKFPTKCNIQKHLFHSHGDLIYFGKIETVLTDSTNDLEARTPEASEKLYGSIHKLKTKFSGSNDTCASNLSDPYGARSKRFHGPTRTSFKKLKSPNTSPSRKMGNSSSSFTKRLKFDNGSCSTPTKRQRQTILTDFMSLCKRVEKVECVSPEKVTATEDAPVFNNGNGSCNETPAASTAPIKTELSTPVEIPKINTPRSEIPFVRIHIDPGMMMELLSNKKLNTELESSTTSSDKSYNLRSERTRLSDSAMFSDSPCKRRRMNDTPRQSRKLSQAQRLKAKFNCKECSVYLERCDKILIQRNYKLENCGKYTKYNLRQDIAKVDQKQLYRCHICSKHFSLKENMREHLELFHVVYMSSICKARYTSTNKLLNHYFRQHVSKRQECCVCRETFKSLVLLKQHMVLHCLKTTQSKKKDTQSVDIEINCNRIKKKHKCKGCRKRFWLRSCLTQHGQVCSRMNDRKDEEKNPRIKESPSSFSEETRDLKGNVTDAQYTLDCSAQYSTNDHPVQAPDLTQRLSLTNAESPKSAVSSSPIKTDARISPSSPTNGGNKRLINGIACVKGYQLDVSGKIKFPCTICGIQFQTFQNLCIHERTFSKPAYNRCNICDTTFPTKRLLQLHMLATHTPACAENYKLFCKFCNQGFHKKGYLQSHERHFHISQPPKSWPSPDYLWNSSPVCNICNLVFESYERFIEHNMYYYKGQVFVCTFCNKSFQGMYQLHHHNKLVHNPESARKSYLYTCDVCNEGFNFETHFHAHKLHVHLCNSNIRQLYVNPMQDHNYALTSSNIAETREPMGVPAKTYACTVCALNFTNAEDLSFHDIEYSVDGDFHCNKCSRKCRTSAILAKHQSLNHAGCDINQSYKCRFCGEVSTTSTSMLCHEKHFHGNSTNNATKNNTSTQLARDRTFNLSTDKDVFIDDTFMCLTCGMKFDDEINLKHHLLEYSNIGEYGCNICQRKFTEQYLLEVHKAKHARVNSTSSPHRCPICNEEFTNVANIRTHVLHLHRYESFGTNKGQQNSQNANNAQNKKNPISSILSTNVTESLNGFASPAANSALKENTVKCPECDVAFSSSKNLTKHRSRYVNSGDNQCTICGRRFPWVTSLEQHLRKHNAVENRFLKHKCYHCEERFRSSVAVYSHIIHIHGKDKLVYSTSDASKTNNSNVNKKISTLIEKSPPVKNLADNSEPLAMPSKEYENDRDKIYKAATIVNEPAANKCAEINAPEKTAVGNDILKNAVRKSLHDLGPPTLKNVQPHFDAIQEKASETSETPSTEVISKTEADSTMNNSNFVGDEIFQRMLELHSNCESSGLVLNPSIDKHDSEAIEIVWEKNASLAKCVLLSDSDPDVQIIRECRQPSVIQQKENSLSVNLKPPTSEVGRLKVRSFAKIVD